MKKYLWAFGFLFLLSMLVTGQHEKYPTDADTPNSPDRTLASTNAPQTGRDSNQTERHAPTWNLVYLVFGWPNGIAIWALFLTLIVIAEQTIETRKAADATEKSAAAAEKSVAATQESAAATREAAKATRDAIILQHRPKIVVRSVTLKRDKASNFEIVLVIRNSGSTMAHLSDAPFWINWITPDRPVEGHQETIKARTLKPGEAHTLTFTAPEFYIRFEASRLVLEQNPNQPQNVFLGCITYFSYTDEIGTRRDTALNRVYDYRQKAFTVSKMEEDYSD